MAGTPWQGGALRAFLGEAQDGDLRAGPVEFIEECPELEIGDSGIHHDEAQRAVAGGERI
jgi:hypothetical protein